MKKVNIRKLACLPGGYIGFPPIGARKGKYLSFTAAATPPETNNCFSWW